MAECIAYICQCLYDCWEGVGLFGEQPAQRVPNDIEAKLELVQLKKRKKLLEKQRAKLSERHTERFPPNEHFINLAEERKLLLDQGVKNEDFKNSYKRILKKLLLQMMERHVNTTLQVSVNDIPTEECYDEKEQYRIYGLLLSASSIRDCHHDGPTEDVKKKISFLRGQNLSLIEENTRKSLSLTHSMLTLLPPLLVTQPYHYYEEIQDTNRVTWDERKREPLIYYRPVLVYGNHLHVAIKGLVGNSETVVLDEENEDIGWQAV